MKMFTLTIKMQTLVLSVLALSLTAGTAHANPKARKALEAVSKATIETDLEKALKEDLDGAHEIKDKIADYTVCLKGGAYACSRYVHYVVKKNADAGASNVTLEYNASVQDGKLSIESDRLVREGAGEIDSANMAYVLPALAKLENDYKGESPIRSRPQGHPSSISLLHIANNGEANGTGDDEKWTNHDNYIVQFAESGYSKVVSWVTSETYLVRSKNTDGKKPKYEVKKLLKLDEILK